MNSSIIRVGVEHGQDDVPELSKAATSVVAHHLLHDYRQRHVSCSERLKEASKESGLGMSMRVGGTEDEFIELTPRSENGIAIVVLVPGAMQYFDRSVPSVFRVLSSDKIQRAFAPV